MLPNTCRPKCDVNYTELQLNYDTSLLQGVAEMKYYVMSKTLYADGDRRWVQNKANAFVWSEEELENAKWHAESFRNIQSQNALNYVHRMRDIPGHRDARVVTFLEE